MIELSMVLTITIFKSSETAHNSAIRTINTNPIDPCCIIERDSPLAEAKTPCINTINTRRLRPAPPPTENSYNIGINEERNADERNNGARLEVEPSHIPIPVSPIIDKISGKDMTPSAQPTQISAPIRRMTRGDKTVTIRGRMVALTLSL